MKAVDVILIPTSNSLSHTKARREACQGGARVVTLPGITVDIMERTLNVDYQKIVDRTKRLADVLTIGRTVRITTPAGTDVTMSIAKAKGYADTGLVHEPGGFSNLPAGEACIAPQEGQTEGIIVVEGSMGTSATMKTPITLIVKDGYAVRIKGGEEAYTLRRLLKRYKRPARNIAELGIGTNHKAKLGGSVLEDEKVLGTVHIALGNNVSLGGTVAVPQHIDGILLKPTLIIDGRKILDKGKLLI
jgi:leucyl aminopeptidase (aminopeptidase T)